MTGGSLIFSIIAFTTVVVYATDYCNLESCNGKPHTMCTFPSDAPAAACNQMDDNQLTDEEKQEIVQAHNDFRATVANGDEKRGADNQAQPSGIIPPLAWDDGLAEVAQRWANQCDFKHDECRNTDNFAAGQNIAIQSASNGYHISMTDLIKMWYDEVAKYNPQEIQSYVFSTDTGHYTQLVWGTTTHVGCGLAKYYDGQSWYSTYLVCNYGPPGNWIGQQVYQTN